MTARSVVTTGCLEFVEPQEQIPLRLRYGLVRYAVLVSRAEQPEAQLSLVVGPVLQAGELALHF